ncbi:M20/M25/M40 family metallo-hydrolase [Aestuariivirga sp.]|uniref:M20/M25/M40 family metallo-hydrolase n=1 Tax=Aestuariivirga sp. TaxID=2650926 RepID=UPI0039E6D194
MDLSNLRLDTERMLQALRRWVECESPTFDAVAVNRMMDLAAADLKDAGAGVERIGGPAGFGDCLRASFPHPNRGQPGILIMGHLDTVHPVGTLEKLPFRVEGEYCYGPGIIDMKGGNRAALEAITALQQAGISSNLPITFLLTCDEEIGSPGTRSLIEAEAQRHKYVLVPEPALGNGGVITGRYAIARFHLTAFGKPSHAGAALADGRSAVREMARRLIEIEDMTTPDCTFSVGVIHGGQWVNCVPTICRAEALAMAKRQADLDTGISKILEKSAPAFEVKRSVVRPVWEPSATTLMLYETARKIAGELGMELPQGSAGGGSDANFTGAMDIPSLDGLGLTGDGIHTLEERILISSLPNRVRLIAGLLAELT